MAMVLGPAGVGDPIEEGLAVAAIGAIHEGDEIKSPALGNGIAVTPDVENEEGAMNLAGGSAFKEQIKFVGIEFGGASEPLANLDGQAGKALDQRKDDLVRCRSSPVGKIWIHRIDFRLRPDLHGQALG
jgi:hypothetical protein